MITRHQWRTFWRGKLGRTILFAIGMVLIVIAPVFGALPGPGGLFVFAGGMALALQNSDWAKRQYVRFKRWQPKAGAWMDWGLRRRSAKRREQMRKAREGIGTPAPEPVEESGAVERQTN